MGLFRRKADNNPPKPKSADDYDLRDLAYCSLPLEAWRDTDSDDLTDQNFASAHDAYVAGDTPKAIATVESILAQPHRTSQDTLQAWTILRQLGQQPPAGLADQVMGVIVEKSDAEGNLILTAYADNTALYSIEEGGGVALDEPLEMTSPFIEKVLARASDFAQQNTRSIQPHPAAPPPPTFTRITALTPAGMYRQEGPDDVMSRDPIAEPLYDAAIALLDHLKQYSR